MTEQKQNPDLRAILNETSQALAQFNADRLEEILVSCEGLTRACCSRGWTSQPISIGGWNAEPEMGSFKRLLELTHANLKFVRRLSSMQGRHLEYGRVPTNVCPFVEVEYGNH